MFRYKGFEHFYVNFTVNNSWKYYLKHNSQISAKVCFIFSYL